MKFQNIFVSSHMYQKNPKATWLIVGSMNMGYVSDTGLDLATCAVSNARWLH